MAEKLKPIRRIVTGHDKNGRSCVLYDGSAPNANPQRNKPGSGMTEVWVYPSCPVDLSGERDDGNLSFNFEPPAQGGHLRIVQSPGRPPGYDPARDPAAESTHPPIMRPGAKATLDRGGANAFSSPIHRSTTVDYGIVLEGERVLELDGKGIVMKPGDTVIQLGNWHGWSNRDSDSLMAFVMMGGTFEGPPEKPVQPIEPEKKKIVNPVRRIVTADDDQGNPIALSDGPAPDVRTDPARPGFTSTRIWVTDRTPAKIKGVRETLHLPHTIEPPRGGSVFRVVVFPPDASYIDRVGPKEVQAFFESMGSPDASTYAKGAHPYRQRTKTLDFCIVLEGEITLILDTEEVDLKKGDVVIQRGTNHAWSNRSNKPCTMIFSQHDGFFS